MLQQQQIDWDEQQQQQNLKLQEEKLNLQHWLTSARKLTFSLVISNKLEDKVKFRFFENRFVFSIFLLQHTQNSMQQTTRLTAGARFRF